MDDLFYFTMKRAKEDFASGLLYGFDILADGDKWNVRLMRAVPDGQSKWAGVRFLVDARTNAIRRFSTVDAAINAVNQVGFKVKNFGYLITGDDE